MDERDFVNKAEAELGRLDDALTDLERDDFDWQLSDGVLTVELADKSKIIISVNRPAKEIWVAMKSQGLHFFFDPTTAAWRTQSGDELYGSLSAYLTEKLGEPISL